MPVPEYQRRRTGVCEKMIYCSKDEQKENETIWDYVCRLISESAENSKDEKG